MSQRELAAAAGVPVSTVANAESGARQPRFATVVRLLAAAGYTIAFRDAATGDEFTEDDEHDAVRDRAGRRFPAHLKWAGKPEYFSMQPAWWGWHHIAWYFDVEGNAPDHIYYHRPRYVIDPDWRRKWRERCPDP